MKNTHVCPKCEIEKERALFQLYKGNPNGWCRACRTEIERERRIKNGVKEKKFSKIDGEKKSCMDCGLMKDFSEFSPSSRGKISLSSYCKKCIIDKYHDKEKSRLATKRYREKNKDRYLANHRVRQFEYKTNKKVTSDGSITDELLKAIYATEVCHYCKEMIEVGQRTLEHKMPLAKGGTHTADNVTMACFTCNSTKRDLTEEQFKEKIYDNSGKSN